MANIDFIKWESLIKNPDWYLHIVPELQEIFKLRDSDRRQYEKLKEPVYDFFERHLIDGTVALGDTGPDQDKERLPVDTIIIHHTSNPPGLRTSRLSAIELIRLYAPENYKLYKKSRKAEPIFSGHMREGKQVFWPYHWLIRQDGTAERLLNDDEIGWQAGDWDTNCRSVAICFDGDFEESTPTKLELEAAAEIIKNHYKSVTKDHIFGHREVNPKTECPSNAFLGIGGWKKELLGLMSHRNSD